MHLRNVHISQAFFVMSLSPSALESARRLSAKRFKHGVQLENPNHTTTKKTAYLDKLHPNHITTKKTSYLDTIPVAFATDSLPVEDSLQEPERE